MDNASRRTGPNAAATAAAAIGATIARAFDALPDATAILDAEGCIVYLNAAAVTLYGLSNADSVGRHGHDVLHAPGDGADACSACQAIAAARPVQGLDMELTPGVWHLIALSPFIADDVCAGWVHVSHDVTACRKVKQQLMQTAHTYQTLVDAIPLSVFLKDTESRLISCNRSYAESTGLDVESIKGRSMFDYHPYDMASRFRRDDLRIIESGMVEEFEDNYVVNGRRIAAHVIKAPVKDDDGAVVGILGVYWDITERRRAEEAQREGQLIYEAILKNASDAILVADAQGRFIDSNREAEVLFGYTRDEYLRMRVPDVHATDNIENRKAAFREMDEKGSSLFVHKLVRKDGSVFFAEVSGTKIPWGGSHVYLGTFRDISARRRIEDELHKYRDHLESLVEERTRELKAMNRELEAFSYSVSHDLRSPLRAINGFGEALREELSGQLSDDANHYLDRMSRATVRMGELIDGLLNLARVSRSEIRFRDVNLSALAMGITGHLCESDPARTVEICIAENLTAKGDETLLRVLLENLLNNAWKFTVRKEPAYIELGHRKDGNEHIFFVRDNGAGFEMQFAHKLFQPFERLHPHGDFRGTGIGLATVRRIVERHGGRVWAEGGIDQGATIYFTLAPENE